MKCVFHSHHTEGDKANKGDGRKEKKYQIPTLLHSIAYVRDRREFMCILNHKQKEKIEKEEKLTLSL